MKKNHVILGLVVLAAVAALVIWGHNRIHFDFGVFRAQLATADWGKIGIATLCIYVGYLLRSVRWAVLIRHSKKMPPLGLLGTQVMGFTAVALIGRVADPVRPYLVAKKTGLPLSSQIAVYIVERMFDLGSMALIFSVVLLTAHEALPHPELLLKVAKGGLLATVALAVFTIAVRMAGGAVASFMEKCLGVISHKLAESVGQKIRTFRTGLDTIRNFSDFAVTASLSITMWVLITAAYLEVAKAFVASPQLASMSLGECVLLLAVSGTASVFQLPVLGWFTQIGFVAAAMTSFYGATPEASTACAATLLLVTFLAIVPVGLIWAQIEHVSLRKVTVESAHAGEEAPQVPPAEST